MALANELEYSDIIWSICFSKATF